MSIIDVLKQNLKNITIFLEDLYMSYNLTINICDAIFTLIYAY